MDWVAEIKGQPILIFNQETKVEAAEFLRSRPLRADLMLLEHDGKPVWNGREPIRLRPASREEREEFRRSMERAVAKGDLDAIDDPWVTFLINVTDPTDDEGELPYSPDLARQALFATDPQFEKADRTIAVTAENICKQMRRLVERLPENVAAQYAMERLASELIEREPQLVKWFELDSPEMQANLMLATVVRSMRR